MKEILNVDLRVLLSRNSVATRTNASASSVILDILSDSFAASAAIVDLFSASATRWAAVKAASSIVLPR